MISVVLYGRNDSHGYNLHKRAALSLNAIASTLDRADDEIIFVDYNTPDDLPTFPEAIQDTLTRQAQARLRVLRVRPAIHRRLGLRTRLKAIEPIARNVALRRANKANRWVLSTNTDIVPSVRDGRSLSALAAGLPDGFHGAPRIDIPETLWETLDRREPRACIAAMRDWGRRYHIDDLVRGEPFFGYDNPGDFQLALRDDLVAMDGFDEAMILGWHVDSNIARRLFLRYGPPGDLGDELVCYHCDHTRQATFGHQQATSQNSFEDFVHRIERPDLPSQRASWGLAGEEVEEIALPAGAGARYVAGLEAALPEPLAAPLRSSFNAASFGRSDAPAAHVLPYLLDLLASQPPSTRVGWFGEDKAALVLLARALGAAGFAYPLLVEAGRHDPSQLPPVAERPRQQVLDEANLFVFDFTGLSAGDAALGDAACGLLDIFWAALDHERIRLRDPLLQPRLFIGVNVIHSPFEPVFAWNLGAAKTPFSARLRHGHLAERGENMDWLPLMIAGPAGRRGSATLATRPHVEGPVAHGPYAALPPGDYVLDVQLSVARPAPLVGASLSTLLHRSRRDGTHRAIRPMAVLRVTAGPAVLGEQALAGLSLRSRRISMPFSIPRSVPGSILSPGVELLVLSNGLVPFELAAVTCRPQRR